MKKIERVKLKPEEIAAYWWINIIKRRINEITSFVYLPSRNEQLFARLFDRYTDIQWRQLYLKLCDKIKNDYTSINKPFVQNTGEGKHNRLNDELSELLSFPIPDIMLSDNSHKNSSLYVSKDGAQVRYNNTFVRIDLPKEVNPEYVVDGDIESYNFFALLIAIITIKNGHEKDLTEIKSLRENFCEYYMLDNNIDQRDKDKVIDYFNYYFNLANDKGYINGRSYDVGYFSATSKITNLRELDITFPDNIYKKALEYFSYIYEPESNEKRKQLVINDNKRRSN